VIRTPLAGVLFRVTSPRYRDLERTADMSMLHPGRFNTSTIGAVYASREPDTAAGELRRRVARDGVSLRDMHPRSVFVLDVALQSVVDLTTRDALEAWGLTPADLQSDDFGRCQEVAMLATRLGAEGVRWASATGVGQSIALFVKALLPGSRVEVAQEFELTRDALTAIESGARLTEIVRPLAALPLI